MRARALIRWTSHTILPVASGDPVTQLGRTGQAWVSYRAHVCLQQLSRRQLPARPRPARRGGRRRHGGVYSIVRGPSIRRSQRPPHCAARLVSEGYDVDGRRRGDVAREQAQMVLGVRRPRSRAAQNELDATTVTPPVDTPPVRARRPERGNRTGRSYAFTLRPRNPVLLLLLLSTSSYTVLQM